MNISAGLSAQVNNETVSSPLEVPSSLECHSFCSSSQGSNQLPGFWHCVIHACHTNTLSWVPMCPISWGSSIAPGSAHRLPCRAQLCLFQPLCGSCVLDKYANYLPSCAFQCWASVSTGLSIDVESLHCVQVTYRIIDRRCQMVCRVALAIYTPTSSVQSHALPPDCLLHIFVCLLGCISSFWSRCSACPESLLWLLSGPGLGDAHSSCPVMSTGPSIELLPT